jgi:hypothetical protein
MKNTFPIATLSTSGICGEQRDAKKIRLFTFSNHRRYMSII